MAKQIDIPRLLLDAHDTAEALSISERKLWELTNQGDIPCVRIGRRVLYAPHALRAWIDSQYQSGGPEDEK
jgi:predicted DNA-binding transcriptional regulator AlpA